jgi:archaeal type IV pilus assembly protein PilA
MKANQAFKANDEAVSPVIGVILMVAITVVLAAVVFVLVSNLGKTSSSTPTFQLTRDEATDRLSVLSADSDADWNRLAIKGSAATTEFALNAATGATGNTVVAVTNTELTGAVDLMGAGEFIEFCGTGADAADITYTIVDTTANSVIGTFTFSSIEQCV